MAELLSTNGNLISTDELSGNTKVSFVAATGITEGYAVRLGEDGKIYPMDFVGVENQPIIGIAQTSGTTDNSIDVVVEGGLSTITSGLTPSYNYYAATNGSISLTGETYIGTALNGSTIQVWFGNPNGVITPSLNVIDNTITDPANISVPGRYIVPVSGTTGVFVGEENDYADYDGTDFTFILPTNSDKVLIATGPNAGNVYLFTSGATSGWTLSSQSTTLPTSNWSIGVAYKQSDLVIYQNVLYQANGNIAANTAFVIGITGSTWKQIGYGNVTPEYGSITPETTALTTLSATTLVSFLIPSAGVWEVIHSCRSGYTLQGTTVVTFLTTNDNVLIENSKVLHIFINSSGVNVYQGNGTMSTYITTTGPTTLKLRAQSMLNVGTTVYGTGDSYGSSKVSWKKISGFLPSTGSISNYLVTRRTSPTQTGIITGTDLIFNTIGSTNSSIPYNTTTGVYTLQAGVTYELSTSLKFTYDDPTSAYILYNWVDATTNTELAGITLGIDVPVNRNANENGSSSSGGIYTPSTNQTIKLRATEAVGTPNMGVSYTTVKQLGTTNVSQFLGTLSNSWASGNTYPSGALVVNNSSIYQANSTIVAGTGFNVGLSGNTWGNLSSSLRDITKISTHGWGTGLLVASGKVFTFNGLQGNVNYTRGVFTSTGNEMPGLLGMRELVFPSESGTLSDSGIQSGQGYALFSSGNLWMWGYNTQGQLGVGDTTNRFFPVLSMSGVTKVYAHPAQDSRNDIQGRWFILKNNGKVYGTGFNGFGQLGLGNTTDVSTWTEITGAGTNPKSVWNMGSYVGSTFVQRSDNTIWACGYNGYGQLGNSNTTQQTSFVNVTTAWNGGDSTMVIQEMGYGGGFADGGGITENVDINMFLDNGTTSRIASAGSNSWGSLGDTTTTGRSTPVVPTGLSGRIQKMVRIGGSAGSCWVLKTDGTLWNWGYNLSGQLDRGNTTNQPTPAQVQTGILDISLHNHSWFGFAYQVGSPIVRKSDGYYRCGFNVHGQLADSTTTNRSNLVKMRFPQGIVFKLFGAMGAQTNEMQTFYGVDTDNKIWAWGQNTAYAIQSYEASLMPQPVQITPTALFK